MLPPPKKLSNETGLTRWLNHLIQWAGQFRLIDSPDVRVSMGPNGTSLRIISKGGGGAESTPGTFRGEWREGAAYDKGDMVIRGSNNKDSELINAASAILADGAIAGLYEATRDVPAGVAGPVEPPALTVHEGQNVYFWRTVARFGAHVMALRTSGSTQKILLDSAPGPSGSGVNISLSACGGEILSIREVEVCVNNTTKHMLVLASAPY